MKNIDKCLINSTKKRRVSGNNGPRRHELHTHGTIANNVPQAVIDEILQIATGYTGNDLGGDNYQLSQHCDVKTVFTSDETYKQIILQECTAEDTIDETNYTQWRNDISTTAIETYLTSAFVTPYRARVSVMPSGNELNYHIDTDTSVLCRVQIPAQTAGSLFQWKTKTEEVSLDMKLGEAYFVNTGWQHRVINPTDNIRIVLLFGIDYDNIPNKEELLV